MANENKSKRVSIIMLAVALFLILVGDLLASMIQTDFGKVSVYSTSFVGDSGMKTSALLYVPKTATAQKPAPGILAIHGYLNNSGTQDGFAIEFARRGYVVLAIDQPGHGYSDPPANSNAFGANDGLLYLRSFNFVDKNNIGLSGHSMGGWGIAQAAKKYPDDYKSLIMEDSNFATINATFPRNLCYVCAEWSEYSQAWWGTPTTKEALKSSKLEGIFGTKDPVVLDKVYGSIADGTAREFFIVRTTHPGVHISPEAVADATGWFQSTLQGGNNLPPANQTWWWKEIGNLIALIGMVMLLFPVGALILRAKFFKNIEEEAPDKPKSAKGIAWWISAIIIVVVPALTWFPFKDLQAKFKIGPNQVFPETFTSQIMIWLLLVGVIALVLFLVWHFGFNRKAHATAGDYGLKWGPKLDWAKIGKSFLLAFLIALAAYITLVLSGLLLNVDYRIWIFNIKPMSLLQFRVFWTYFIPFLLYFIILGLVLNGQLRPTRKGEAMSMKSEMAINVGLLVIGFFGLLGYQYIPMMMGGPMPDVNNNLHTIIAIQFLPMFTIVALVYTYFFRKTAHIYAAALLCALLVTWILAASQPIFVAM